MKYRVTIWQETMFTVEVDMSNYSAIDESAIEDLAVDQLERQIKNGTAPDGHGPFYSVENIKRVDTL